MKSSTMCRLAVAVSILLALGACKGRENAAGADDSATIAPAQPQPETTGTEALTQTTEVGDGRNEEEGGTSEAGTATAATATTTVPTTTATATTATTTTR